MSSQRLGLGLAPEKNAVTPQGGCTEPQQAGPFATRGVQGTIRTKHTDSVVPAGRQDVVLTKLPFYLPSIVHKYFSVRITFPC